MHEMAKLMVTSQVSLMGCVAVPYNFLFVCVGVDLWQSRAV